MSTAASAVALKRKKILLAFWEAEALSADRARSFEDLGLRSSVLMRRMARSGVLVDAGDGRYYLDEEAEQRDHHGRLRRSAWFIAGAILVIAAIWVFERL